MSAGVNETFCAPLDGDCEPGALVGQLTVNCFVTDCRPLLQFGRLARTTQLYCPGVRPFAGPLHEPLFAPEAEQTRTVVVLLAKTS